MHIVPKHILKIYYYESYSDTTWEFDSLEHIVKYFIYLQDLIYYAKEGYIEDELGDKITEEEILKVSNILKHIDTSPKKHTGSKNYYHRKRRNRKIKIGMERRFYDAWDNEIDDYPFKKRIRRKNKLRMHFLDYADYYDQEKKYKNWKKYRKYQWKN